MPYMLLPFALLIALVTFFLVYRSRKTGHVTYKVKHLFFNRINLDLMLSMVLVVSLCAFFLWSDLKKFVEFTDAGSRLVYGGRIAFYLILVAVFLARQMERPALREKGISSARWFWTWDRIRSYRWNGALLEFQIGSSQKNVKETWAVVPEQKQELDRLLRQKIKRQGKKAKRKKPSGR